MKSFAILVVVLCCAFCLAKEDQMNPAKSKLRQRHIEKRTELSICKIRRAKALWKGGVGVYVPQCEADGSFKPMQCSGSTGYCWCVDRYGCEIIGTQVPPGEIKPVCVKDESKCEKQRAIAKGRGIGAYVPQCEADGSYSPTQCSGSTGYCWCVNVNGDEIPDTKVPPGANKPLCTECEKQRSEGENQVQPGTFVPKCDAVGYFKPMQCSGSTGYCWCVDGNGNEIPGTKTPPGSPQQACRAKDECEMRRREAENQQSQVGFGGYVPQCEADGSFNPVQCSGSTGYCWCVNKHGCEIPGTQVPPGEESPNCSG